MPRVWALLGDKPGDNAQVLSLARSLGQPFAQKRLRYNLLRLVPNWLRRPAFASVASGAAELRPPWPDVVIAIGRRSAPVARGIKQRSGGRTRLVHLGRPRAPLSWFDLVLTTPQYGLPRRDNVLHLDLPIGTTDRAETRRAAEAWKGRLGVGSSPRIALLVGGSVAPYRLDRGAVETLAAQAMRLCEYRGASLLVACGRRVRPASRERLRALTRDRCAFFHAYDGNPETNPYLAYLATAEEIIVTADSVSMMSDAVATGRPVHLFAPPLSWRIGRALGRSASRLAVFLLGEDLCERLVAAGVIVPLRRAHRVSEQLVERGQVCWLGDVPRAPELGDRPAVAPLVVARVQRVTGGPAVQRRGGAG